MLSFMEFELYEAARKLLDLMKVKEGEEVVITCDTASDWNVVRVTSGVAASLGAKPLVLLHQSPQGVGKAADPYLPIRALESALVNADVWIEFNRNWLLYSTPYWRAVESGRVRYICLVGMNADMMVRTIGRVNVEAIYEFQRRLAEITRSLRYMRIETPSGTDVEFENDPSRPVLVEGEVSGPGEYMLFGQVDWAPVEESINGVIAFDGSVWPPEELGLLRGTIKLHVREGVIRKVEGGVEAKLFERWLRSFEEDAMLRIAHLSYGCNPGAKLTGNILEDERVWGVVEWGIGSQSRSFKGKLGPAKSHTDGICLSPTVKGEGVTLIENGDYTHPELKEISLKLIRRKQ
ncbi:MAG: aminopeptidase [Candidatus Korarchaeum sp.]